MTIRTNAVGIYTHFFCVFLSFFHTYGVYNEYCVITKEAEQRLQQHSITSLARKTFENTHSVVRNAGRNQYHLQTDQLQFTKS